MSEKRTITHKDGSVSTLTPRGETVFDAFDTAKKLGKKAVASAAIVGTAAAVFVGSGTKELLDERIDDNRITNILMNGDVNSAIQNGELPEDEVIRVSLKGNGVPWTFAKELANEKVNGAKQTLAHEIAHQVGDDGVQSGEQVILTRDHISEEALQAIEDQNQRSASQ